MIKYCLTTIAIATLGVATAYAGPIADHLVEIGPSDVGGLYVIDTNPNGSNDFNTSRPFKTSGNPVSTTKPAHLENGRLVEKTKTTVTNYYDASGFNIIGNHDKDGFFSSASNSKTGKVIAKIGKDETNFCLVTITFGESDNPTDISGDCSSAKDFEWDHVSSEGPTHHIYFRTKTAAPSPAPAAPGNTPAK